MARDHWEMPAVITATPSPSRRAVTGRCCRRCCRARGHHQGQEQPPRTKANITKAPRRSIPLRVGLVDVQDGQRIEQARAELEALGVTEIGTAHLRQVGRGIRQLKPSIDQLCGHCAQGKVAVSPNGDVWPCVFARWMPVGNVRRRTLVEILTGPEMATAIATLVGHFPVPEMPCVPGCVILSAARTAGRRVIRRAGRMARVRAARKAGVCRTTASVALMTKRLGGLCKTLLEEV
jgi:Iron-sulfur cluster-binding domain